MAVVKKSCQSRSYEKTSRTWEPNMSKRNSHYGNTAFGKEHFNIRESYAPTGNEKNTHHRCKQGKVAEPRKHLTWEEVCEIRALPHYPVYDLARKYDVTHQTITKIRKNQTRRFK
jgi:hypothetical protein